MHFCQIFFLSAQLQCLVAQVVVYIRQRGKYKNEGCVTSKGYIIEIAHDFVKIIGSPSSLYFLCGSAGIMLASQA